MNPPLNSNNTYNSNQYDSNPHRMLIPNPSQENKNFHPQNTGNINNQDQELISSWA